MNTFNNNKYNFPTSEDNHKCIGPCYPPNTVYYHPILIKPFISKSFATCPINKTTIINNGKKMETYVDECNEKNITENFNDFNIFDNSFEIASTFKNFLSQLYLINNVNDVNLFLNDIIDEKTIYSQKRILNSIFQIYFLDINFALELFISKVKIVLKKIYDLDLSNNKIKKNLFNIKKKEKYNDIFLYFTNKYSK